MEWLQRWGNDGLLFLRSVREVGLRAPSGGSIEQLSVSRKRLEPAQIPAHPDAMVHRQIVEAPAGLSWMVHTAEIASPPDVSRVRKAKESTTAVGVAFPLHDASAGQVYAGLPVVETSLPLFVNAQFDPLTSRRDLADTDWNRALVPLVADIWAHAAADLFRRSPEAAWRAMPVGSSSDEGPVSAACGPAEPSDPQEREDFRGRSRCRPRAR